MQCWQHNPLLRKELYLTGYGLLGGAGSNNATIFVKLKSFEERSKDETLLKYIGVHNEGSMMVLG